jgi:hypothetical protein
MNKAAGYFTACINMVIEALRAGKNSGFLGKGPNQGFEKK